MCDFSTMKCAAVAGVLTEGNFEKLTFFSAFSSCLNSILGYNVLQFSKVPAMTANAVVRARIDERIKEEASVVLAAMGLTVSDAFRILLTRVAHDKALPFEPLAPNGVTIAAMKAARKGGLKSFNSVAALMADLNADD